MSGVKGGGSIRTRIARALPEGLRSKLDAPLRTRHRVALAFLTLVAVAFFVALPGYIGSRPEFFRRYASMQSQHESWSASTHAGVACERCHVAPERLAQSAHRVRMLAEFYASIVLPGRQPDLFGKPGNDACEQCHRDIRQASPSGDLKIPHRAHVQVLKLDCVHCHAYSVHSTNPEGTHSPRMATCLECHDGRKAKRECSACHTAKDAPESHRAGGWLVEHAGKRQDAECQSCHAWTQDWCSDCHARRPESHSGKWRSTHRDAVAKHRNCEACHREDFCVRCHGELPRQNFDPGLSYVE